MNPLFFSLILQIVSIIVSYLILYEFKISNRKEPCKVNDRYMKQLIDKIDKVVVSDKINKE